MNCSDCKYFGAPSLWTPKYYPDRSEWRDCEHPDRRAISTGYDHYAGDLSCAPDFGCIQFEKKEKSDA